VRNTLILFADANPVLTVRTLNGDIRNNQTYDEAALSMMKINFVQLKKKSFLPCSKIFGYLELERQQP
jgi:hypothetical protein